MLNVYEYFDEPKSLNLHDKIEPALQYVTQLYRWGASVSKEDLEPIKGLILKNPKLIFYYTHEVIEGRWPEAEHIIAKDPSYAYSYALYVIKGPFKDAEPYIAEDPSMSVSYATNVLDGRFEESEAGILKTGDVRIITKYAESAIKGPWPEAESIIMKDPFAAYMYAKYCLKKRWNEAEPTIKSNSEVWNDYRSHFKFE